MKFENRAIKNVLSNTLVQVVLAIVGLTIPKLIIERYGSGVNGMVSAISQFIAYAALVEMGIGNASVIALYKPLAQKDGAKISDILTCTKRMYLSSALIYTAIIVLLSFTYPLLYLDTLDYWKTFNLILCIGAVNAIDFYFLGKYKVLLTADRKYYVLNITRAIASILLIVISVFLIVNDYSIFMVKLVAVITHLVEYMAIKLYVTRKYSQVSFSSKSKIKIAQRWNALVHQICSTIVYNTDLVVLTLFLPKHDPLEISVYSVYALVLGLVTNLASVLTTGIDASFGNMIAKDEKDKLENMYDKYEYIYFIFIFFIASCFISLILSFVGCYTKDATDVNYIRPIVAVLFAINGLTAQIKNSSGIIINAHGRYKETQQYAIEEAVINIVISLLLVRPLGITGVLIGTLASHLVMAIRYISYMNKELIVGSIKNSRKRILRNTFIWSVLVFFEVIYIPYTDKWLTWLFEAIAIGLVNLVVYVLVNELFEKKLVAAFRDFKSLRLNRN